MKLSGLAQAACVGLVLCALAACQIDDGTPASLVDGDHVKVAQIIKGDEVEVEKGGKRARLRLLGVHAFSPVIADAQVSALAAGGVAALGELVHGKEITLRFDQTPRDPSGRYLAYLESDGVDIGQALVTEGWAVVYTEFSFARESAYLAAEKPVRVAQRNVWGLKPAADLIQGLRRQWQAARLAQGGAPLADAILATP